MIRSVILFLAVTCLLLAIGIDCKKEFTKKDREKFGKLITKKELKRRLLLEEDQDLVTVTSFKVGRKQKVKLQQVFIEKKGKHVPVYSASLVAEKDNGLYTGYALGTVAKNIKRDLVGGTKPKIRSKDALIACKQKFGHVHVHVNVIEEGRLYIHPDIGHNKKSKLVFKVEYFYNPPARPTNPVCIVDARKGVVLKHWEGLRSFAVNSVGGNVKTNIYHFAPNGLYPPLDVTKNGMTCSLESDAVKIVDFNGDWWALPNPSSFECQQGVRSDSSNGGYSPLSDSFYFAKSAVDCVKTNLFAAISPTSCQKLTVNTHFGYQYEYMFYTPWQCQMYVPDGASSKYPFPSADTIGHEVGHAFIDKTSELESQYQASGIAESLCDIFGEFVEHCTKSSHDFKIGATIVKAANGLIRDLCDPTSDGHSIDHVIDYTGTTDGHYSAGIYNKAFCNLIKPPYSVGIVDAFRIFAHASYAYFTQTTTFAEGVCHLKAAAADLNINVAHVTGAFSAVGAVCTT